MSTELEILASELGSRVRIAHGVSDIDAGVPHEAWFERVIRPKIITGD